MTLISMTDSTTDSMTDSMAETQQHFEGADHPDRSVLGLGLFFNYQDAASALEKLKDAGYLAYRFSFLAKCSDRYDPLLGKPLGSLTGDLTGNLMGSLTSACVGNLLTGAYRDANTGFSSAAVSPASSNMMASLAGLVAQPRVVALPEIGPVIAGGALSSVIAPSGDFKSSVTEALGALGIPERSAGLYSDRIGRGDCLIGVEGSSADILQAKQILRYCRIIHWQTYKV